MEKQISAVEWLVEQLTEVDYGCINKTFLQNNNSLAGHKLRELLNQAKEMEKEQSECICVNVIERILNELEQGIEINSKQIFEDVYNKTFKSQ